ncbi:GTPase-activating protein CIN2 LALA0_S05e07184g [Lachancea lanzarotensis]|uniref:LALA0S05e07184g1_1 n=1 Tax=Lachancea lanzarotensis TaxID=1245769 RepID=A0A0C7N7L7_9SACH|nr:uncharacterized protein LALA0_S05e07184g [Lachancea lanzarotensis]CEP62507.1 LALA0S05e07184g1_1 [Lachancea lanzarotensis]
MRDNTSDLTPAEFSKVFGNACNVIEQKTGQKTSASLLKRDVMELFALLRSVSDSISAYDREKYNSRLTRLLKQITAADTSATTRKFQFKTRPQKDQKRDETYVQDTPNLSDKSIGSPKCIGKTLEYRIGGVYENLEKCSLTFGSEESNEKLDSAAILIRSCHKSVINFKAMPFVHGSVYIENAQHCIILFRLPESSQIQIRLHELENCDIYMVRVGLPHQSIVLENCTGLRFHGDMRKCTKIHDFSSVGKTNSSEHPNYQYESFDLCNFDTPALVELVSGSESSI